MTEKWHPTADFYLNTPRSATIRETCLPVLATVKRFLYDPAVTENPDEKQKLLAQMELANGTLIELGIVPEMHEGKTLQDFKKSPVMTAEYLAGQLLPLLGDPLYPEGDAGKIAQELSLLPADADASPIIDLSNAPSLATDFMRNTSILNFIRENFAVNFPESI